MIRSHTLSIALAALALTAGGASARSAAPSGSHHGVPRVARFADAAKIEQRVRVRQHESAVRADTRSPLVVFLRRMFRDFGV